jgi:hypothetical protein
LSVFNEHFAEFVNDVHSVFPDDVDILTAKNSLIAIRKANPKQLIHPDNSIFIPFNAAGDLTSLSELFNKTERFYCYDNYTFLYTQAAMCGCLSIVVPDGVKTKEEWLEGSPFNRYGVAYGEDDIPRAIETLPLLFKEIENQKHKMIEQTLKFANNCNNLFI